MPYPDADYGSITIDTETLWNQSYRPPLVPDAEAEVWRTVWTAMVDDLLISSFMARWRTRGLAATTGVHLTAKGAELQFRRPSGWTDARYRPVVMAIERAAFGRRTAPDTIAIASALVTGSQAFEVSRPGPLIYCVAFYEVTDDEALFYAAALEFGRPRGVSLCVMHTTNAKADAFQLDLSTMDGPDQMVGLIVQP